MGYWGFSTTRAASHRWAGSGPISRRADQAPPTPRSADSSCTALSSGNRPYIPPKVSLSPWQQSAVRQAKDAPPRVHHQTLCWPGHLPGIQVLVVCLLVLFWEQSRNWCHKKSVRFVFMSWFRLNTYKIHISWVSYICRHHLIDVIIKYPL